MLPRGRSPSMRSTEAKVVEITGTTRNSVDQRSPASLRLVSSRIEAEEKTTTSAPRLWKTMWAEASINARCTAKAATKRSSRLLCRLSETQGAQRCKSSRPRARS
jgi:hypothetical protein